MSPQLYAFILGSRGGVSAAAVQQWARRQGLNPDSQLRQLRRATEAGLVQQRAGAAYARVAVSVIYYVPPAWHREQSA